MFERIKRAFGFGKAAAATVAPPAAAKRSYSLKDPHFWAHFSLGRGTVSSRPVSADLAFSVPPFFSAVRYIAEGVAMLDRVVKHRTQAGVLEAHDHPISYLMHGSPHPNYTWSDLISALLTNACLGNGYLRIHRDPDTLRPVMLEHIPAFYVSLEYDEIGWLWAFIAGHANGRTVFERVSYDDIIHIKGLSLDGVSGMNVLHLHEATFNDGAGRQEYSGSVLGKGARPSLAIKTDQVLDEKEVSTMEDNFMRRHGGAKNSGRPLVLDGGQDIRYLQWSPMEAALDKLAQLNVEDVSRMTKVPPEFLALDRSGTYGASVQRSQNFLTYCLGPWLEKIQDEFNRKLFYVRESRSKKYWFEFDTSMFLALDKKSEAEVLVGLVAGSILTPNEARAWIGYNPLAHGDELMGNINTLPLEDLTEVALAKYLSSEGEKARAASGNSRTDTEDGQESATE